MDRDAVYPAMKKVTRKVSKLAFPRALPATTLETVVGGTNPPEPVRAVRPRELEPCFHPGTIIPCVRPR